MKKMIGILFLLGVLVLLFNGCTTYSTLGGQIVVEKKELRPGEFTNFTVSFNYKPYPSNIPQDLRIRFVTDYNLEIYKNGTHIQEDVFRDIFGSKIYKYEVRAGYIGEEQKVDFIQIILSDRKYQWTINSDYILIKK